MHLPNNWFTAFVLSNNEVALDVDVSTGDNPLSDGNLDDRMAAAITGAGKLRVIESA